MLLEARHISRSFGGVYAVNDASLQVEENELVGLIGTNGAGKTTLFNILTGFEPKYEGDILLRGQPVHFGSLYHSTRRGVARTFQNIRLFEHMTVEENILVAQKACKAGAVSVKNLTQGTPLAGKEKLAAGLLTYGQMRVCEILRAISTGCSLLLLDEPAAGMTTSEKQNLAQMIRKIMQTYAISILVIEHDIPFIKSLCGRLYMMHLGQVLAHGTTQEVLRNPQVLAAFTGEG